MVAAGFFNPVIQVGRGIRIELGLVFAENRVSQRSKWLSKDAPPALPELRVDDAEAIAQRKAEAFLQTVRHGAIRR